MTRPDQTLNYAKLRSNIHSSFSNLFFFLCSLIAIKANILGFFFCVSASIEEHSIKTYSKHPALAILFSLVTIRSNISLSHFLYLIFSDALDPTQYILCGYTVESNQENHAYSFSYTHIIDRK